MANNEIVLVPRKDIEKIEEARLALYKMFEGMEDVNTIIELMNITESMWYIAHRKYPTLDSIVPDEK